MRNRLAVVGILVIVIAALSLGVWGKLGTARARAGESFALNFDGVEYHAGTVRGSDSATVKHAFSFRNDGRRPVKIVRVATSCGCTAAKPTSDTVAPGETGQIAVELKLHKLGFTSSDVAVHTDAGAAPKLLRISGDFRPAVRTQAAPTALSLVVQPGEAPPAFVDVMAFREDDRRVGIAAASAERDTVGVAVSPGRAGDFAGMLGYRTTSFRMTVRPRTLDPKIYEDRVVVRFDAPDMENLVIPVTLHVTPRWLLEPSRLVMIFGEGELPVKHLVLSRPGAKSTRVANVDNPFAEWLEVSAAGEAGSVRFTFRGKHDPAPAARTTGEVRLLVSADGQAPEAVNVPLVARIVPRVP